MAWRRRTTPIPANTGDPFAPAATFPTLNSLGQGTGSATSPNIIAQVYQGNIGVTNSSISNLTASAKYSIDGRNVSIDQTGSRSKRRNGNGSAERRGDQLRQPSAMSCRRSG